jgi:hypothetical protein
MPASMSGPIVPALTSWWNCASATPSPQNESEARPNQADPVPFRDVEREHARGLTRAEVRAVNTAAAVGAFCVPDGHVLAPAGLGFTESQS